MRENSEKKHYLPPGLTVLEFKTERGFASSDRHTMDEYFIRPASADAPSTGEDRSDQGWLF